MRSGVCLQRRATHSKLNWGNFSPLYLIQMSYEEQGLHCIRLNSCDLSSAGHPGGDTVKHPQIDILRLTQHTQGVE